jgi:hypothetical protein
MCQGAIAADHQVRLMDAEGGTVNDLRLRCHARILEDQIAHGTWRMWMGRGMRVTH